MKKFLLFFVAVTILGVAVPQTRANLGDTVEQVKVKNFGLLVQEEKIDGIATVVVFSNKETTLQYAVGVIGGRVECEVFSYADDRKFSKEFVLGTIHSYRELWYPVSCDNGGCVALISEDGQFYARLGESDELHKHNVLSVASQVWYKYAMAKTGRKPKNDRITL